MTRSVDQRAVDDAWELKGDSTMDWHWRARGQGLRPGVLVLITVTSIVVNREMASGSDAPACPTAKRLQSLVAQLNDAKPEVRKTGGEQLTRAVAEYSCYAISSPSVEQARSAFAEEAKPVQTNLIELLRHTDPVVVESAAIALGTIGSNAKPAAPALRLIVLDPKRTAPTRLVALANLAAVTPESESSETVARDFLKSDSAAKLEQVLSDCESSGYANPSLSGHSIVVEASILLKSGHTTAEVPWLVMIARGAHPRYIRGAAICLLGEFAFDGKTAVPALMTLLKDKDKFIRYCAADALVAILNDRAEVAKVCAALDLSAAEKDDFTKRVDQHLFLNEAEMSALRENLREANGGELLDPLRALVSSRNGFYRRAVIRGLGAVGPDARQALPDLRRAENEGDADTRLMAKQAIRQIEQR
jgi:HEAT repeat protein